MLKSTFPFPCYFSGASSKLKQQMLYSLSLQRFIKSFYAKRTKNSKFLLKYFNVYHKISTNDFKKKPTKKMYFQTQCFSPLIKFISELCACKVNKQKETQTELSFENYILKKLRAIICGTQKGFSSQQHFKTQLFPAHSRQDCTCLGPTQVFTQRQFS